MYTLGYICIKNPLRAVNYKVKQRKANPLENFMGHILYSLMFESKHRSPAGHSFIANNISISKFRENTLDSKVHGANMGPIWDREDPGGPHVGPMNFAIWDYSTSHMSKPDFFEIKLQIAIIISIFATKCFDINMKQKCLSSQKLDFNYLYMVMVY